MGEEVAGRNRDDTELGEKIAHGGFGAGEKGPVGEIGAVGGGVGFQDGGRVVDGVERQRCEVVASDVRFLAKMPSDRGEAPAGGSGGEMPF